MAGQGHPAQLRMVVAAGVHEQEVLRHGERAQPRVDVVRADGVVHVPGLAAKVVAGQQDLLVVGDLEAVSAEEEHGAALLAMHGVEARRAHGPEPGVDGLAAPVESGQGRLDRRQCGLRRDLLRGGGQKQPAARERFLVMLVGALRPRRRTGRRSGQRPRAGPVHSSEPSRRGGRTSRLRSPPRRSLDP